VTADEAPPGQTINFACIYGQWAPSASRAKSVEPGAGKSFSRKTKRSLPQGFGFSGSCRKRLALTVAGYVETILGRRRPFALTPVGLGG